MTLTALAYHSISYGAHDQCAPFDTVPITSIRRTNRRFSVKLANYREEGVIYRSEKLDSDLKTPSDICFPNLGACSKNQYQPHRKFTKYNPKTNTRCPLDRRLESGRTKSSNSQPNASEKLASSHFTYITHYCEKSEQQEIAIKQKIFAYLCLFFHLPLKKIRYVRVPMGKTVTERQPDNDTFGVFSLYHKVLAAWPPPKNITFLCEVPVFRYSIPFEKNGDHVQEGQCETKAGGVSGA
ncbi:hypothetical protein TNCV_324571 [Trichonephila clavipes]|nr:hypothetical protein TNCV_324571 [Trichonephila clavipes]